MSLINWKRSQKTDSEGASPPAVCPVTGMPILRKPEWTYADSVGDFKTTYRLIGSNIVLGHRYGYADSNHTKNALRLLDRVLWETIPPGDPYVHILDYTYFTGISASARKAFIKGMKNRKRMFALVFYGASPTLNLAIKLAKRLNIFKFKIQIVNSYSEAIQLALEVLTAEGVYADTPITCRESRFPIRKVSKEDWMVQLEGYTTQYQLIDGNIIHGVVAGSLEKHCIEPIFAMFETLMKHISPRDDDYYFVFDIKALNSGSRDARMRYIDRLKKWHAKHPCRMYILCGANRFFKTVANLARPLTPFPTRVTKNLSGALDIIRADKQRMEISVQEDPDLNQKYVKQLLHFLGSISWETNGLGSRQELDPSHPFIPVFDAIKLIKSDLDTLLSERNRAGRALIKSEEKYRSILESIEEGYGEIDLSGKVVFFNDALCHLFGYEKNELLGQDFRAMMDQNNSERIEKVIDEVFRSKRPRKDLEFEAIKKNGDIIQLESSVYPKMDVVGNITGYRGLIRNITDRKITEALQREKISAEVANRAKSDFLAKMSHEIRTPLNGIIGMTELVQDTDLDDNQRSIFQTINSEASALVGLINDILDFSKIEAGKLELEETSFDLNYLVENVVNGLSYRAQKKDLEIISFISPDITPQMMGDPGRLRQILVNLIGNAVKFTHEGEILVKAEKVENGNDTLRIRFSVKDTGIGISREKQATIFDSFTQADGSTTRNYGGSGLGTAISKQLVDLMGGDIGVESEEGKGSLFWFTANLKELPRHDTIENQVTAELNDIKVLVVDNAENSRSVTMEYLQSSGCLPSEAPGSKAAVMKLKDAVASKTRYDLMLIDLKAPEVDSFDLAKIIRTMKEFKTIPILVATAIGEIGDARLCKEINIQGYLTKPIKRAELSQAVKSVLTAPTRHETTPVTELITRHAMSERQKKNIRILLVEDYPTNQLVAMKHLETAGYRVDLAEDGRQAVEAYQRNPYNLILMDIQMPRMDGYEATRKIRVWESGDGGQMTNNRGQRTEGSLPDIAGGDGGRTEGSLHAEVSAKAGGQSTIRNPLSAIKRVPIIAMTAHAVAGYKTESIAAGMDDYITKPLRRNELLTAVERWLVS